MFHRTHLHEMNLKPFFGYFGGKWRSAGRYTPPKFDTIVEPFAGSAGYSVRFHDRQVILLEANPTIAGVWQYLISADPNRIASIPDIPPEGIAAIDGLTTPERNLLGLWCSKGPTSPVKKLGVWAAKYPKGGWWGPRVRERLSRQVEHIRHWKIYCTDYSNAPAACATWFIDPPYQQAGKAYPYGSTKINFEALSAWCGSRDGQVIVCEALGADWLPFIPLYTSQGTLAKRSHTEVVWEKG